MLEPTDIQKAASGISDDRSHGDRRGLIAYVRWIAGLVLTVGFVLGGCAIPFGNGIEPTDPSSAEQRRERNRLYLEEQQRVEQQRQFDRIGPSDR